jgi:hypothetical protein
MAEDRCPKCGGCRCAECGQCECTHAVPQPSFMQKFSKITISIVFFWHIFLLEILAKMKLKKELSKHPEKLVQFMFEAMFNAAAQGGEE